MTTKQKAGLCAFGVAALTFIGTVATPLCSALPLPWQVVCVASARAATEGARRIEIPDAGE